jgi:HD-GYP domain-containing protein (c-di-GMP phosphodiesterase class II)
MRENNVQLKAEDIIIGAPISWDCFDKAGILLLRKGQIIESSKQLAMLVSRGLFHSGNLSDEQTDASGVHKVRSPFELLREVQSKLDASFSKVSEGTFYRLQPDILYLCDKIQQSCAQDADASIGSIFLNNDHKYIIRHPVNVAVVCEILSQHLKWSKQERVPLLAAALTMNISILNLQEKLSYQQGRLNNEQQQSIREHPEGALKLLTQAGVGNTVWREGVLYHHEAIDGSGYPSGLSGQEIPLYARIISVGDRYCAGVSNRPYRRSLSCKQSMKDMFLNAGQIKDQEIVRLCVKSLGIYPPGTFVKLANGEIAVVTHRGEKAHAPIVHSVLKSNKNDRFTNPKKRDCSEDEYAIVETACDEQDKISINPDQLWGYGISKST